MFARGLGKRVSRRFENTDTCGWRSIEDNFGQVEDSVLVVTQSLSS